LVTLLPGVNAAVAVRDQVKVEAAPDPRAVVGDALAQPIWLTLSGEASAVVTGRTVRSRPFSVTQLRIRNGSSCPNPVVPRGESEGLSRVYC
jgi:hypothetical protein